MQNFFKTFFLLFYAFLACIFWFLRSPNETPLITYALSGSLILILLISGIMAIRAYGLKSVHGKAILLLIVGQVLKIVWGVFYILGMFAGQEAVTFSAWEFLGIAAYVLMMIGLVMELKQCKITWTTNKILTNVGLILVLSALVIYFGLITPGLLGINMTASIAIITDLLMGIFAVLIFTLVSEYRKGKMAIVWTLIMFSFLVALLGDILVANFNVKYFAQVWPYRNLGHLWFLSFLLLSHGFFQMNIIVKEASASLLNKKV